MYCHRVEVKGDGRPFGGRITNLIIVSARYVGQLSTVADNLRDLCWPKSRIPFRRIHADLLIGTSQNDSSSSGWRFLPRGGNSFPHRRTTPTNNIDERHLRPTNLLPRYRSVSKPHACGCRAPPIRPHRGQKCQLVPATGFQSTACDAHILRRTSFAAQSSPQSLPCTVEHVERNRKCSERRALHWNQPMIHEASSSITSLQNTTSSNPKSQFNQQIANDNACPCSFTAGFSQLNQPPKDSGSSNTIEFESCSIVENSTSNQR